LFRFGISSIIKKKSLFGKRFLSAIFLALFLFTKKPGPQPSSAANLTAIEEAVVAVWSPPYANCP
jgi:hypothetical protein